MSTAGTNCVVCKQITTAKTQLKCNGCENVFHYSCDGITEAEYGKILPMNKPKWKCQGCKSIKATKKFSPRVQLVTGTAPVSTPTRDADTLLEANSVLTDMPSSMVNVDTKALINYFDSKISTLRKEWSREMNDLLKPVQSDLQKLNDRLDDWETRLAALELQVGGYEQLACENTELKKELEQTRRQIDTMDQNSRNCNVEIQNIPETNNEKITSIVQTIGQLIGVNVPLESIRNAHRTAPGIKSDRPKNIVVQFTTKHVRDAVLNAARVRRDLNTEQLTTLQLPARKFYINEHLTLKSKMLLTKCRAIQKTKEYKYVWVQDGTIKMRKTGESKVIKIRSEEDLEKVL